MSPTSMKSSGSHFPRGQDSGLALPQRLDTDGHHCGLCHWARGRPSCGGLYRVQMVPSLCPPTKTQGT
jgi:hypothetical protein